MTETIVSAALCIDGLIISAPRPARHHTLIHAFDKAYLSKLTEDRIVALDEQGFLTSTGRFVGRREAAGIALEARQIDRLNYPPQLYSEDLW